jgi:hypothetical protein
MVLDSTNTNENQAIGVSELGPIILLALVFLVVMGGIAVVAYKMCNGHVNMMSIDYWKGVGKIQCR